MKIGYARVSTGEQNLDLQLDALSAAGCAQIFHDYISRDEFKRPGLAECMEALSAGDELIVWKLDRFGGNMLRNVTLILGLDERGVGFRSLTESFDMSTPIGRGVLAFMSAIAEDELERIRARTKAGIQAALLRGVRVGRPAKLSAAQIERARALVAAKDRTRAEVAALFGVSTKTLWRALRVEDDGGVADQAGRSNICR